MRSRVSSEGGGRLLGPHCPLSRQEGLKTSICDSELGMHQPRRKVLEPQGSPAPQPGSFCDPGHPGFLKLGFWCWLFKHIGDLLAQASEPLQVVQLDGTTLCTVTASHCYMNGTERVFSLGAL